MIRDALQKTLGRDLGVAAVLLGAVLIILSHLPVISGSLPVMPQIPLMMTVYWSMRREEPIPAIGIFTLGALDDLLSGAMPFANAILLTAIARLIIEEKKAYMIRTPKMAMIAFSAIVGAWGLAYYVLNCLWFGAMVPVSALMIQMLVTIAVFPVALRFFGGYQRLLTGPEAGE